MRQLNSMSDHEATLLEEHIQIAVDELERASGLSIQEITELVEYGVFQPAGGRPHEWRFAARCIAVGRTAHRLRDDFELSTSGLALTLSLIERIEELQREIRTLQAQALRG
jgi:chaperone modulatory protein CbpM